MNTAGWFKSYRIVQTALSKDPAALQVLNWLNCQSSDSVDMSYRTIGEDVNLAAMTVFDAVKRLVKIGAIVVEANGKKTIAKVVTHDKYTEKVAVHSTVHPTVHPTVHQDVENNKDIFDDYADLKVDGRTPDRTPHRTKSVQNGGVLYRSKNKEYTRINNSSPAAPKTPPKSGAVIKAYKESYHGKYGVEPISNAKTNSIACKLVDAVGEQMAIEVIKHFVASNDRFFVAKKHPIGLCLSNIETIATEVKLKATNQGGIKFGTFKQQP